VTVIITKYVLDENGRVVVETDDDKWSAFMERGRRHVVGYFEGNGVKVSTIFLGIDHRHVFGDEDKLPIKPIPILWETMVFGGCLDGYQERYTSAEDALRGHVRAMCRATRQPMPRSLFTEKLNELVRAHDVDPGERCAAIESFLDIYYAGIEEEP